MPIFMHYEGIDGNVTAVGYKEWFELESFHWGCNRQCSTPTGRAANREVSAPSVSEVVITKKMDRASPQLLEQALVGQTGRTVTLTATRTGKELEAYFKYKFEDVMISSYSIHAGGNGAAVETLTFNFDKISWKYWPTKAEGQSSEPITVGYDIGQATRM